MGVSGCSAPSRFWRFAKILAKQWAGSDPVKPGCRVQTHQRRSQVRTRGFGDYQCLFETAQILACILRVYRWSFLPQNGRQPARRGPVAAAGAFLQLGN